MAEQTQNDPILTQYAAKLMDGKKVAESVYSKLLLEISLLPAVPKIAFVLVGDDAASQTYVKMKSKKCLDLGIGGDTITLPSQVSQDELSAVIARLNQDRDVHGILVQLPLPAHLSKNRVIREISPLKDVDGLHPDNAGRLWQGDPRYIPCTPLGVMEILKFYNVAVEGKRAVVIGRSEIVGKPMAQLLLQQNATVTICHSKTAQLSEEISRADIVVAALGKPEFIRGEMIREGAVVVDVGIHRIDGKIKGDVHLASVAPKASLFTPVPGGVGPMTIAMLMKNVVLAANLQDRSKQPTTSI